MVDKHSTGGVGDKTSIRRPVAAACGVPVAMVSGRGLGHTGGTLDKLESIPGSASSSDRRPRSCATSAPRSSARRAASSADKKLYALRDVTATVDIVPLIASHHVEEARGGHRRVVLDVKVGDGAFMKTIDARASWPGKCARSARGAGSGSTAS